MLLERTLQIVMLITVQSDPLQSLKESFLKPSRLLPRLDSVQSFLALLGSPRPHQPGKSHLDLALNFD